MVNCWFARMGKIKMEDGSILKMQPFDCPHARACFDYFSTVFKKGERMTKLGLLMDPNPAGPDFMLRFLRARCPHPQKHEICMHIASLPSVGVLIPNHILDLIEEVVVHYES